MRLFLTRKRTRYLNAVCAKAVKTISFSALSVITSFSHAQNGEYDHSATDQPILKEHGSHHSHHQHEGGTVTGQEEKQIKHRPVSGMEDMQKHDEHNHHHSESLPSDADPQKSHLGTMHEHRSNMLHKNGNDHSHAAMQMGPMQGGSPPPDARNPDAYAHGLHKHPMHGMDMADDAWYGRLLVNELEYVDTNTQAQDSGQFLEIEGWYGGDSHRAWFKAEGERRNGRLEHLRTEALWNHVFATFWSTQLGLRHDTGQRSARHWLALGIQGLAPYWFETEATAYIGNNGQMAARAEARYDLFLTQRAILQPKVELNMYTKDHPAEGIGSGLADMELGLRLRYEVRRQFAPYIGVTWKQLFHHTAEFARQNGEATHQTQIVAGVRMWF